MINEEVEIGLHGNYWKGLKEYYEIDYEGVAPGKKADEYAQEIEKGEAPFLELDKAFDPNEIKVWIKKATEMVDDEWEKDANYSETLETFPHLLNYSGYEDQIAAYFLLRDLDRFRDEIANGNKEFVDEAIRLNWIEMIEEIQTVKDLFLF